MRKKNVDIDITRPQKEDVDELRELFHSVIQDAFQQDEIDDEEGIITEVEKQMRLLHQDLESRGARVFFLIARTGDRIVGTIAYSEANELICNNLKIDLQNISEITSVYILPAFQGQGVGSLLFNGILISLHHKKVELFCLDGGYKKSQRFWINKLGYPSVTLQDYWGEGLDHMIWLRNVNDVKIRYQIFAGTA